MKKKLLACVLALAFAVGSIPVADLTQTTIEAEAAKKKTPTISKLQKAVEKALGDNYVANVSLSKDEIKERFGISSSWYTGVSAKVSMINTQVDTLVIVKAKNAKARKKIKSKLTKYRKNQINSTMQYPSNLPKLQASRVYTKGDFVFFISLGFIDRDIDQNGTEEQIIKAYKAQNQLVVDAINAQF